MTIRTIPVGTLETNCYLVYDENKRGIVIDPGAEGDRLLAAIEARAYGWSGCCLPMSITIISRR